MPVSSLRSTTNRSARCGTGLFTEAEHGDGYVDEATPELAIAVVDGFRGRGVGRALMEAAHAHAAANQIAVISLSVDEENPARRLYESLGYVPYAPDDPKRRMVLHLTI